VIRLPTEDPSGLPKGLPVPTNASPITFMYGRKVCGERAQEVGGAHCLVFEAEADDPVGRSGNGEILESVEIIAKELGAARPFGLGVSSTSVGNSGVRPKGHPTGPRRPRMGSSLASIACNPTKYKL
jgi:hypothetical protein